MNKRIKHLMLWLILVLIVPSELTADNDPVPEKTAKGFLIGLNVGGMVSDLASAPFQQGNQKHILSSFTFGASYISCLTNLMDIKLGVQYDRKGIVIPKNTGSFLFSSRSSNFELKYLTIHQSVLFTTRGSTFVYIGPGIYQAFLLHASHSLFSKPENGSWAGSRRFDFGPSLQAGIGVEVIPNLRAHLEFMGTFGMMSVYHDEMKSMFEHTINRSFSGTVALTYNF